MTSFREHMAADAAAIMTLDEAAEDLIFTPLGGAAVTVRGAVEEMPALDDGPPSMPRVYREGLGAWAKILLPRAVIASQPGYRDKVARDGGATWTIQQAGPEGAFWACWAVADERMRTGWQPTR
ncbi:MAG: hypothetical protein ACOZHQ_09445 [Thermodesulfobacteriota bacterium]